MQSAEGTWDLTMSTPIGRVEAVLDIGRRDGVLTGSAHGTGEEVPLTEVVLDGDRLTWKQAITKPLRLNLAFDVTLDGDTLTGTSRAGRLPSSKVTGRRRGIPSEPATGT
ncbi:hypothetical protein GCM10010358_23950 [Streptomyces minutiscleroticus]|uniref:Uncharacterized protein n=1 Tax=Streptomyces minutiscleroticus TaxID=68238 RepID=A0A918NHY2_9ACTN|nr:hypothetical protein [Streptomyces minutiscleroticus]GGX68816.1 hypothetical protein GCM10010358_23950 [Streptomyces minutiscleroticus]